MPETQVLVIGKRTLANGKREYDEDIGYYFVHNDSFQALLVVKDMMSKPFFVPIAYLNAK